MEAVYQYKYGTIYRDVLHLKKVDWCFYMNNLDIARNIPLFHELLKLLDDNAPGFVRPCPWKVIATNFVKPFLDFVQFYRKFD